MDPDKKRKTLSDKENGIKNGMQLFILTKENLLSNKEWYISLDKAEKEQLLPNRAEWYKSLDTAGKKNFLSNRAEQYKLLA